MIYGIGADMTALERIEKLHKKYGQAFAERLLSRIELLEYPQSGRPADFLAKRFAAKEAFAKAVGTGLRSPVSLRNIGVGHDELGKPEFICEPDLQKWLQAQGIKRVHLSMSDEGGRVLAFAVAEA